MVIFWEGIKFPEEKAYCRNQSPCYYYYPPISIKLVSCLLPVALHISPSIQYSPAVPAVQPQYCTPPPPLEGATGARRGNCLRRYARCASASVTARTTVVFRSLTGRHIMKVIQTLANFVRCSNVAFVAVELELCLKIYFVWSLVLVQLWLRRSCW